MSYKPLNISEALLKLLQGIDRKVDACVAISKDLISAINEKISGFAFNLKTTNMQDPYLET